VTQMLKAGFTKQIHNGLHCKCCTLYELTCVCMCVCVCVVLDKLMRIFFKIYFWGLFMPCKKMNKGNSHGVQILFECRVYSTLDKMSTNLLRCAHGLKDDTIFPSAAVEYILLCAMSLNLTRFRTEHVLTLVLKSLFSSAIHWSSLFNRGLYTGHNAAFIPCGTQDYD
jgi:hypothetical protein